MGLRLWPTPGIRMTVVRCLGLLIFSSPKCSFSFRTFGHSSAPIGTFGNRCMSGHGRLGMILRRGPPLCIHDTLRGRPGFLSAVPFCRLSPFCYRRFPWCLNRVPWMSLPSLQCHPVRVQARLIRTLTVVTHPWGCPLY